MSKLIDKLNKTMPWKNRLRRYIEERQALQQTVENAVFKMRTINNRIQTILDAQDRRKVRLSGIGQVTLVTPVKTSVDLEGLIDWYTRKRPTADKPVTYVPVLDEKALQIHFKRGIIKPERFAKFVTEEEQNTYVRVDKPKGKKH